MNNRVKLITKYDNEYIYIYYSRIKFSRIVLERQFFANDDISLGAVSTKNNSQLTILQSYPQIFTEFLSTWKRGKGGRRIDKFFE